MGVKTPSRRAGLPAWWIVLRLCATVLSDSMTVSAKYWEDFESEDAVSSSVQLCFLSLPTDSVPRISMCRSLMQCQHYIVDCCACAHAQTPAEKRLCTFALPPYGRADTGCVSSCCCQAAVWSWAAYACRPRPSIRTADCGDGLHASAGGGGPAASGQQQRGAGHGVALHAPRTGSTGGGGR